jgi:hypothetical protein
MTIASRHQPAHSASGDNIGQQSFATAKRRTVAALVVGIGSACVTLIVEPEGFVLDTNTGFEWKLNADHGPYNWAGAVTLGPPRP